MVCINILGILTMYYAVFIMHSNIVNLITKLDFPAHVVGDTSPTKLSGYLRGAKLGPTAKGGVATTPLVCSGHFTTVKKGVRSNGPRGKLQGGAIQPQPHSDDICYV